MQRENDIAALILAGGYSSRAQAFKPLLPLGDATIIEKSIDNFRRAGIYNIRVVLGHRAEELMPLLLPLQIRCIYNAQYDDGMFSSVIAGLQSFRQERKAFYLLPVDIPLVRSHTIRLLHRSFHAKKADVVYPVFQGRRGHPPLIAVKCIPEILAGDKTGGLRPILQKVESNACEVEVLDEGILLDADTPVDYRKIIACYNGRDVPSQAECNAIFHKWNVQDCIINHGRFVAEVARKLAIHLNRAGLSIDVNLLIAAAKLHDLAKGQSDHARVGARILKKLGYPKVAKVIAVHHDIHYEEGFPPDEAAIVYLADKLVKNERIVTIDERFQNPLEKYAANTEVLEAVMRRQYHAQTIHKTVEQIVGADLAAIIAAEC